MVSACWLWLSGFQGALQFLPIQFRFFAGLNVQGAVMSRSLHEVLQNAGV